MKRVEYNEVYRKLIQVFNSRIYSGAYITPLNAKVSEVYVTVGRKVDSKIYIVENKVVGIL